MSATDNGSIADVPMVLVSAGLCSGCGVGRDTGEGRDQAGQVRDDRFMEISHSTCNQLLQLYDFLLWAASQFYK